MQRRVAPFARDAAAGNRNRREVGSNTRPARCGSGLKLSRLSYRVLNVEKQSS